MYREEARYGKAGLDNEGDDVLDGNDERCAPDGDHLDQVDGTEHGQGRRDLRTGRDHHGTGRGQKSRCRES